MYATVLDFILGAITFFTVLSVPKIKAQLSDASRKYRRNALLFFLAWFLILVLVIILQIAVYTVPSILGTVQLSNILNAVIEVLNTIEFVLAYEYMRVIEFMIAVGVGLLYVIPGRVQIERRDNTKDSSDAASDAKYSKPDEIDSDRVSSAVNGSSSGKEDSSASISVPKVAAYPAQQ